MSTRIPPGSRRQIGLAASAFSLLAGRVMQTRPPAVFTTLARTRRVFWGWLLFSGSLMPFGHLSRRESEMVILRVAFLSGSDYEMDHHKRLGRRAGLSTEEIAHLLGGDTVTFNSREEAILETVASLHENGDVDDTTWEGLRAHLDEREAIELLLLVAQYQGLAQTLQVLRIPVDQPKN
jgi:AhpD family alkylhydroperoxidase